MTDMTGLDPTFREAQRHLDDAATLNADRATRALELLAQHARDNDPSVAVRETLRDFLADARHLAELLGIDFDTVDESATEVVVEELADELLAHIAADEANES